MKIYCCCWILGLVGWYLRVQEAVVETVYSLMVGLLWKGRRGRMVLELPVPGVLQRRNVNLLSEY